MRFRLIIAAGALPILASGCAPVDPGYGDAIAYNKAAQIIDPDPEYTADDAQPGDNGERGAAAVERYRKGTGSRSGGGTGARGGGGGGLGGSGGGVTQQSSGPL